ncbi:MAG TPA: hypothetical protein VFV31_00040 [Chitinophagaceae bacterium]|nr:hypothetical protein [Chitinophagaceae bacterium]
MTFSLIQGQFSPEEGIDILSRMIEVKIKFHEDKILHTHREEDITMRERRIQELQHELHEIKKLVKSQKAPAVIEAVVNIR